jgi:hypothetical protein
MDGFAVDDSAAADAGANGQIQAWISALPRPPAILSLSRPVHIGIQYRGRLERV